MPTHGKHTMPGGHMMSNKEMKEMSPANKTMPPTSKKPAANPALAKLPEQAKAYGVRGTKPPTAKKGK